MIIKVCGMGSEANTRGVERLEPDWMGFIFYRKSPRYVGELLAYVPARAKVVGVFVDEDMGRILALAGRNRLEILQLHGDEPPDECRALREKGFTVVKSFGIATGRPFPAGLTGRYEGCCDYFLFDTRTALYGGSGRKFAWEALSDYGGDTPFLLGGGISPGDAGAVKRFSHPAFAGIDLNSGFETSPAVKDLHLLQSFIGEIR